MSYLLLSKVFLCHFKYDMTFIIFYKLKFNNYYIKFNGNFICIYLCLSEPPILYVEIEIKLFCS